MRRHCLNDFKIRTRKTAKERREITMKRANHCHQRITVMLTFCLVAFGRVALCVRSFPFGIDVVKNYIVVIDHDVIYHLHIAFGGVALRIRSFPFCVHDVVQSSIVVIDHFVISICLCWQWKKLTLSGRVQDHEAFQRVRGIHHALVFARKGHFKNIKTFQIENR